MAFTGKPLLKPAPKAQASSALKPNPYPGSQPKYVPCHDCGRTGRKKYQVLGGNEIIYEEDECKLCSGLGWVAT